MELGYSLLNKEISQTLQFDSGKFEYNIQDINQALNQLTCTNSQFDELRNTQVYFPIPTLIMKHLHCLDEKVLSASGKLLYLHLLGRAHYQNYKGKSERYRYSQVLINIAKELGTCFKTTKKNLLNLKKLGFIRLGDLHITKYKGCVNAVIDVRFPKKSLIALEGELIYPILIKGERPRQEIIELRQNGPECTARQFHALMQAKDEHIVQMPVSLFTCLCLDARLSKHAKLMYIHLFNESGSNPNYELCLSAVSLGEAINLKRSSKPSTLLSDLAKQGYLIRQKKTILIRAPKSSIKDILNVSLRKKTVISSSNAMSIERLNTPQEKKMFHFFPKSSKSFEKITKISTISNLNNILNNNTSYLDVLSKLDNAALVRSCLKFFLKEKLDERESRLQPLICNLVLKALAGDEGPCKIQSDAQGDLVSMLAVNGELQHQMQGGQQIAKAMKQRFSGFGQEANDIKRKCLDFSIRLRKLLSHPEHLNELKHTDDGAKTLIKPVKVVLSNKSLIEDKQSCLESASNQENKKVTDSINLEQILSMSAKEVFKSIRESYIANGQVTKGLSSRDQECMAVFERILSRKFNQYSPDLSFDQALIIEDLIDKAKGLEKNGLILEFSSKCQELWENLNRLLKQKPISNEPVRPKKTNKLSVAPAPKRQVSKTLIADINVRVAKMKRFGLISGAAKDLNNKIIAEQVFCHAENFVVRDTARYAHKYQGLSEKETQVRAAIDLAFFHLYQGTFVAYHWQKRESEKWQAEAEHFKELDQDLSLNTLVA